MATGQKDCLCQVSDLKKVMKQKLIDINSAGERLREGKNLKRSVRKIVKGSMETFTTLRIRKEPLGSS